MKNDATLSTPLEAAASGRTLFEAGKECVQHRLVALQREDQGDVDRDAVGQAGRDRRQHGQGGRDLDEQVRPVHQPPQAAGLGRRALGVAGDARVHLDRHPSVAPARAVINRAQDVAGGAHVPRRQQPQRLADGGAAQRQLAQLRLVAGPKVDRLGEDRGVGRDADGVALLDLAGPAAGLDAWPAQVIKPYGDAGGSKSQECLGHADLL